MQHISIFHIFPKRCPNFEGSYQSYPWNIMKPTFTSQSRGSKLRNWRRRLRLDYLWQLQKRGTEDGGKQLAKMYENVKHDAAEIAIEREREIWEIQQNSAINRLRRYKNCKTCPMLKTSQNRHRPTAVQLVSLGIVGEVRLHAALNSRIWIYWIYCCILMCQLLQLRGWREICWSFARRAPPKSDSGGGKADRSWYSESHSPSPYRWAPVSNA